MKPLCVTISFWPVVKKWFIHTVSHNMCVVMAWWAVEPYVCVCVCVYQGMYL